jgi:hypothetical protein
MPQSSFLEDARHSVQTAYPFPVEPFYEEHPFEPLPEEASIEETQEVMEVETFKRSPSAAPTTEVSGKRQRTLRSMHIFKDVDDSDSSSVGGKSSLQTIEDKTERIRTLIKELDSTFEDSVGVKSRKSPETVEIEDEDTESEQPVEEVRGQTEDEGGEVIVDEVVEESELEDEAPQFPVEKIVAERTVRIALSKVPEECQYQILERAAAVYPRFKQILISKSPTVKNQLIPVKQYQIRWKGYSKKDDSWVLEYDIHPDTVKEYKRQKLKAPIRSRKRRRLYG